MASRQLVLVSVLIILAAVSQTYGRGASFKTFRSLFARLQDSHLAAIPNKVVNNFTIEQCAKSCAKETQFECKSFDFDNIDRSCRLHNASHESVVVLQTDFIDHYRTAYKKLFHRIPNHVLTLTHKLKISHVSVEECARRCILEMLFQCRGFDYEARDRNCWLSDETLQTANGVKMFPGADFYGRIPEGALAEFNNYGYGSLRPVEGDRVYQRIMLGISLESCAQVCLGETSFKCVSMDYHFNDRSCLLSQYSAAKVFGINTKHPKGYSIAHFERTGQYISYFYTTPYSAILGNNEKTVSRVTPERCARSCMEEERFICRSFDYQIKGGRCLLSSKTGSDVAGLYNQGIAQTHHFEMKPILDCGGYLTGEQGNFASPNWPRDFAPHTRCMWRIKVPAAKVIHLYFTHFDLGHIKGDSCDPRNDRLIISELTSRGNIRFCTPPHTKKIVTKTNSVTVTFRTNDRIDSAGFRVFYFAEWPCDADLVEDNGEFASPHYPKNYDASTRCTWRIKAPSGSKIILRFSFIEMESHGVGVCNDRFDRVKVYDGSGKNGRILGTYCGTQTPISLRSSGSKMFIEFKSDERVEHPGFHASYKFIHPSTSTVDTRSATKTPAWRSPKTTPPMFGTLEWYKSSRKVTASRATTLTAEGSSGRVKVKVNMLSADFTEQAENRPPVDLSGYGGKNETDWPSHNELSLETEDRQTTTDRFFQKTIWAMATSLAVLVIVIILVLAVVCRLYRNRQPKSEKPPSDCAYAIADTDDGGNIYVEKMLPPPCDDSGTYSPDGYDASETYDPETYDRETYVPETYGPETYPSDTFGHEMSDVYVREVSFSNPMYKSYRVGLLANETRIDVDKWDCAAL